MTVRIRDSLNPTSESPWRAEGKGAEEEGDRHQSTQGADARNYEKKERIKQFQFRHTSLSFTSAVVRLKKLMNSWHSTYPLWSSSKFWNA